MNATREMVDHVRRALMRVDADLTGTPDYEVLAEAAIVAVMERLAVRALQRLQRDMAEDAP